MKPTISEIKSEIEELKKKFDTVNGQLIDERIANINKDLNGIGGKLSQIETDIKDLQAFKNKTLAYGSAALIIFPIITSALMKYLF